MALQEEMRVGAAADIDARERLENQWRKGCKVRVSLDAHRHELGIATQPRVLYSASTMDGDGDDEDVDDDGALPPGAVWDKSAKLWRDGNGDIITKHNAVVRPPPRAPSAAARAKTRPRSRGGPRCPLPRTRPRCSRVLFARVITNAFRWCRPPAAATSTG